MSVSQEQIKQLREAFLQEMKSKGDTKIHPNDLNRINNDDDYIRRFLLHHECDQKLALDMMWEVVTWRFDFKTNDINEKTIRMDYIEEGGFFSRGRDIDGCALFIFKCKKHTKGARDMDDVKRCVVYWFERLERQEKGKPITLFFDMEGCGLSNMDMDFIKYLIGLFKQYYPYFLNYIIILEMAWVLNAAFKIVKTWLPEKAVQKIKMVKKSELHQWVTPDQALKCWGGNDNYVFEFVSDTPVVTENAPTSNKKVHFADGSPMSDAAGGVDKETDGGRLSVTPSSVITFHKDGDEYISTLELQNNDPSVILSYKMKTTAPEKFRVRPSAGVLAPGDRATIMVTLLPAYQIGGLHKDKFLVMSIPVDSPHLPTEALTELWKNTSGKNVSQHRLSCAQLNSDSARNGTAVTVGHNSDSSSQIMKITSSISQLQDCQKSLHEAVRNTQVLQLVTMVLILILGVLLFYISRTVLADDTIPVKACIRESEL